MSNNCYTLENEYFSIEVASLGAELKKVLHKPSQESLLWDGNPSFWAKTSPVLFPIVGTLKHHRYSHNGSFYSLGRHGFAREKEFYLEKYTDHEALFVLTSDASTREIYPFDFKLNLSYQLIGETLKVSYKVENISKQTPLIFSLGAHPAFRIPMIGVYDEYYLEFVEDQKIKRFPLTEEGLLMTSPEEIDLDDGRRLQLTHELFYLDALVIKSYRSKVIKLYSSSAMYALYFDRGAFPYLGLWAAKNAPFVCIEPWQGLADSLDSNGEFAQKEGVLTLLPGEQWNDYWSIQFKLQP